MADDPCPSCGHRNPEGANFCSSCGSPLPPAGGDHTMTLPAVPDAATSGEFEVSVGPDDPGVDAGALVIKRGPGAGSRFVLDADVVSAGRHPESDIFLDDVTVSRRHAEVSRSESGYRVRDAGSLNGTYLNRTRIDEAELHNGDELQIGRFKLVFLSTATDGVGSVSGKSS